MYMNEKDYVAKVEESLAFLQKQLPYIPRTLIQLGTGLGDFANTLTTDLIIPFEELPNFPKPTVPSHSGNLHIGKIGNHSVAVLQGRYHYYEGYSTQEVAFPVRVLSLSGVENMIITNAAGGLNPLFKPGSIMIIRDHLNFLGENPLRGPNVDHWGPRFPDLSEPYHRGLVKIALDSATKCGLNNVISGVYVCIPGPSLETPAETRWLRQAGADAVGMSTVPEVLVALHGGLKVLGLSAVSNVNDPDNFQPILLEDILATSAQIEPVLARLITEILQHI